MEIEQIDNYIKEKYLRTDENDIRGTNSVAVNKFINMIHKHLQSDNQNIRVIGGNIDKLATLAPNFILFEEQNNNANFMKIFNAMMLGNEAGELALNLFKEGFRKSRINSSHFKGNKNLFIKIK